jgi:hypothetical protein
VLETHATSQKRRMHYRVEFCDSPIQLLIIDAVGLTRFLLILQSAASTRFLLILQSATSHRFHTTRIDSFRFNLYECTGLA